MIKLIKIEGSIGLLNREIKGGKEKKKRQKREREEKRGGIAKKTKEHSEFYAELI